MAEPEHESRLGLTATQVIGSALAAVSGAIFASWAGTAGTVIGAALGSVIATVGTATYTWWLRRTSHAVRQQAARVRRTGVHTAAVPRTVSEGPLRDPDEPGEQSGVTGQTGSAAQTDTGEAAGIEESDEAEEETFPWRRVALASAVVLGIALVAITLFEAIAGKPVSSIVNQDSGSGTTVGHVVGSDRQSSPSPAPHGSPGPTPTTGFSPGPRQGPSPSPSPTLLPSSPAATDTGPPVGSEAPSP